MGTWIVGAIVFAVVCGAAYVLYRDHKNGKGCSGCDGCKGCANSCGR